MAQAMPTHCNRKLGLPSVGFNMHENVYFGQNHAMNSKIRAHRRHGAELPKIVVKHHEESNNSTLSSMHRDLMIRRPNKKPSAKASARNRSINVGGGHVSDLFFANRPSDLQVNASGTKAGKSSIEESSNAPTDRTGAAGPTT